MSDDYSGYAAELTWQYLHDNYGLEEGTNILRKHLGNELSTKLTDYEKMCLAITIDVMEHKKKVKLPPAIFSGLTQIIAQAADDGTQSFAIAIMDMVIGNHSNKSLFMETFGANLTDGRNAAQAAMSSHYPKLLNTRIPLDNGGDVRASDYFAAEKICKIVNINFSKCNADDIKQIANYKHPQVQEHLRNSADHYANYSKKDEEAMLNTMVYNNISTELEYVNRTFEIKNNVATHREYGYKVDITDPVEFVKNVCKSSKQNHEDSINLLHNLFEEANLTRSEFRDIMSAFATTNIELKEGEMVARQETAEASEGGSQSLFDRLKTFKGTQTGKDNFNTFIQNNIPGYASINAMVDVMYAANTITDKGERAAFLKSISKAKNIMTERNKGDKGTEEEIAGQSNSSRADMESDCLTVTQLASSKFNKATYSPDVTKALSLLREVQRHNSTLFTNAKSVPNQPISTSQLYSQKAKIDSDLQEAIGPLHASKALLDTVAKSQKPEKPENKGAQR